MTKQISTLPAGPHRWHVLDDGVLVYGLALLRTLWLAPALQLFALSISPAARHWLPAWLIFGLLAGGTFAAQCAARMGPEPDGMDAGVAALRRKSGRPGARATAFAALGGLAAVLIAVYLALAAPGALLAPAAVPAALAQHGGRALFVFFLAAALWWWGLRTGSEMVGYDLLAQNFLLGVACLLGVIGGNAAAALLPRAELLAQLLVYLAAGLFLLALASIQATRRYERRQGEPDLALPSHWWATVVGAVAMLLLVALLLSLLFAPETLAGLAALVGAILALIGQALAAVIAVVSYPFFLLLAWLLSLIPLRPFEGQPPEMQLPQGPADLFSELGAEAGTSPGNPAVWWMAAGVLAVAAVLVLFVLAIRRLQFGEDKDDVVETHESILTLDLLKAQLADLLRRGQRRRPTAAPYIVLAGDDPATRVRRTYQQLLEWAAANGHGRQPGMTPDHYCEVLSVAYPAHRDHFVAITHAYRAARYGGSVLAEADAAAAGAAWQQIRAASLP